MRDVIEHAVALNLVRPKRLRVVDAGVPLADIPVEEPGEAVVFFSLEMPREQLASRLLASEARVDLSKIRGGRIADEDWARLTETAASLARMPLWLDDTPALSLLEARGRVRRLKSEIERGREAGARTKLSLVVVDYLQLMQGRRDAGWPGA